MYSFLALVTIGLAAFSGTEAATATNCAGRRYTANDMSLCYREACQWAPRQGPGGYPHNFGNYERLDFGPYTNSRTLREYPLRLGGRYTGGAPGADRCVVHRDPNTQRCTNIGAMTHTGAAQRNGFVRC
ncbi:putative guanyl-specific ribonuclease f1 [Neofusicoccum parvum]|uniref:Guanyl-specific ribonuclease f1 n=1 Tax=Neofusicoccum parvum TaxID=310453 RepID=A0ACB5SGQ1_9PEZI|nr:putative guanyl-specific ribonuclease f1 [Neofusicoccum parvum]GME39914.1 putative guanyl-specific ribonuclease f1 [Neofusicoccum parvum]